MGCPSGTHFLCDRHSFLLHQRTRKSLLVLPVRMVQETLGLRTQKLTLKDRPELACRKGAAMKKRIGMRAITRIGSSTMAIAILTFFGFGLGGSNTAFAQPNEDVTPDVIFGSGNSNGSFTTVRKDGVELGLRAKIPFVGTINSNGDGTYSYSLADTDLEPGGATLEPRRWNFDWTVNTDWDGSSGLVLDDLTYELGMDAHQGLARSDLTFDPITPTVDVPFYDHSIGDNSTANGAGVEAVDASTYSALLASKNVLQQSWRYSFFSTKSPMDTYDPDESGSYDVYLLARDSEEKIVARVDIRVYIEVVPPEDWLTCVGFDAPMNEAWLPPALGGGEIGRKVKKNKVLPFKASLLDTSGNPVTEVAALPDFLIFFVTGPPIVAIDVTDDALSNGKRTEGVQFKVISGDSWSYNMSTKGLAPGQYYAFIDSGDMGEYVIGSLCVGLFVIK